jgi:hypothetical protein
MNALSKIREAGFGVEIRDGEKLAVNPVEKLTESQRDFLKANKSKIIDELIPEQLLIPKHKAGLKPEHRQKLLDYMAHIGETYDDMIKEYLTECENNPLILQHQLEFIAAEMESKAPAIEKMVRCGDCLHWQPINQHGRGAGHCAAGVYPMGGCHWSETHKLCASFEVKK